MTIEHLTMTPPADASVPPLFSKAVKAGDTLYLSGQVGFGPDGKLVEGGIETEARQAIQNVIDILAEFGADLSHVVKVTIWIADKSDYAKFNRVYAQFFTALFPARSLVCADLISNFRVEIEVIASLSDKKP